MLQCAKTIIFYCQRPKSSSKALLKLDFSFHDDLCCRVEYSNVEYQVKSTILIIKSDAQKQMI